MSIPGEKDLIKIIDGSMGGHPRCNGQLGDLKIKMPDDMTTLEGEHEAFWVCSTCKKEIPCRVKIDLKKHEGN